MFTAEYLRNLMSAHPFKPFRICMSDGKSFDIPNHDAALVARSYVEVARDPDEKGFADIFDRCAILHITRVEELQLA